MRLKQEDGGNGSGGSRKCCHGVLGGLEVFAGGIITGR